MDHLENISKYSISILKIFISILILVWIYSLYQAFFGDFVFIRFKELGPLTKNMSVYYKGFVIGKTTSVGPDEDYKASMVKVRLNNKYSKLPKNTFAVVKQFPGGQDYLEFVYPDKPTLQLMKKGDILEGITSYSLEKFMYGQSSGANDIVSNSVLKTLDSTELTNQEIQRFFATASDILSENRETIKQTTRNTEKITANLAKAAENIKITSQKINIIIDEKELKNSTKNINQSTMHFNKAAENIQNSTGDINKATKNIDKTIIKVDTTFSELQSASSNINRITEGLYKVLCKRFAGIRLLFGKPISEENGYNNCTK